MFTDDNAARETLEAVRWPNGPVCPHCGGTDQITRVEGVKQSHRPGLLYCNDCKGQFTVTVGTVFERSKIPLTKWWKATFLLCSSTKGISSHQVSRRLDVTYKTAWFMTHRIREAMKDGFLTPIDGSGKTVEADETVLAKSVKTRKTGPLHAKPDRKVLSLVECGGPHLHRYLAEFDFRFNNRAKLGVDDVARTVNAMKGIEGKRLTYRQAD
jgi:transposase-like protein